MADGNWMTNLRRWVRTGAVRGEPAIGVALGGGFARAIAHLGVLRALERNNIPIAMISGVSAGAMVAAAYASGATLHEIAAATRLMKFTDVANWTINPLGLAASARMGEFLARLLKADRFEQMRIPLAVVATDLVSGQPVVFRESGDVIEPIRASCSYPGLFAPVRVGSQMLVDGAMSMEIPAAPLRRMGATHVISVPLPIRGDDFDPRNLLQVVNRCFQILQGQNQSAWRRHSSIVIEPNVTGMAWNCFDSSRTLIERGEQAAEWALPRIRSWLAEAATTPSVSAGPDTCPDQSR